MSTDGPVAIIRTSDRALFKRCRRKWSFGSHLKRNLDTVDRPSYFWIGTGGHFALEDHYGYNYYGHPVEAFNAYVEAQRTWCQKSRRNLPDDWKDQWALGVRLLEYYLTWIGTREDYATLWVDGEPQVEIKCVVDLTPHLSQIAHEYMESQGYVGVVYQGTLDRVVEHEDELWGQDWKFFKTLNNSPNLEFDQQMSSYCWLGDTVYPQGLAGMMMVQIRKDTPNLPKILSTGRLSTTSNQKTTHNLYRDALLNMYGTVKDAPHAHRACLTELAERETEDRDDFIRRDRTRRNKMHKQAEGTKILMEVEDMLNPNLPLYPNATRDCSWDCQLSEVCLMMDRGDHWQAVLEDLTVSREEETEDWREYLKR